MKRTHLFALLMTLAASNVLAASMQQSPKQIPFGQGSPVENQLMLTQNTTGQTTPSSGTESSGSIEGKSAGGELQTTIIDDNGNLKVVPKSNANKTNNAGTSNQPGTTTPGMAAEAPARPKQAEGAAPTTPNAQPANPAPQGNQPPYAGRPPVTGQPNGAPAPQSGQTPPVQPPLTAPTPPATTTPPMAVPNQAPTPATPNGAMPPAPPATR